MDHLFSYRRLWQSVGIRNNELPTTLKCTFYRPNRKNIHVLAGRVRHEPRRMQDGSIQTDSYLLI